MPNYKHLSELKSHQRKKREKSKNHNKSIPIVLNSGETLNIVHSPLDNVELLTRSNHIVNLIENNETEVIPLKKIKISDAIASWVVNHDIKREAVSDLLKILHNDKYPEIVKSYKSLLLTPRTINTIEMPPGNFIYLGLKKSLLYYLSSCGKNIDTLEIDVNIDGAPIFENSRNNSVIWPILVKIHNIQSPVFPIAIYGGNTKPNDFNMFLLPFINEYLELEKTFYYNDTKITLKIRSFVLDAPARSSICGIVGHTGYFSCPKCHCEGSRSHNKTVFLRHENDLRNNEEFRGKTYENHNRRDTVLTKIENLDMINDFPIDYLHNCLLGIMKKLLDLWFGKNGLYTASCKMRISEKIKFHDKTQPSDFQRKLRGLEKMSLWKGTELRTFLLYIGPIVLNGEISKPHYKNFMLFHVAISILTDKILCVDFNEIARILINSFVDEFEEIYGQEYVTYNVHLVTHLSSDCKIFGNLDNFSSFPFESYLGKIKRLVKSPHRPLQQIHNRISEIFNISSYKCTKNDEKFYLDKHLGENQFLRCRINNICFTGNSQNDSYVQLINKSIVKIEIFQRDGSQINVFGRKLISIENSYTLPLNSRDIDEYKINVNENIKWKFNAKEIYRKFYVFHINDNVSLFFPMSCVN